MSVLAKNLKFLMQQYGGLTEAELYRKADIAQSTLQDVLSGKTKRPRYDTLKSLAEFFSISIPQLTGSEPLPKPFKSIKRMQEIPLLAIDQVQRFLSDTWEIPNDITTIQTDNTESRKSFAITMSDASLEPRIPKNAILIFDPDMSAQDRRYALLCENNSKYTVKQILVENGAYYVKKIENNTSKIVFSLLSENQVIIAILVELRTPL